MNPPGINKVEPKGQITLNLPLFTRIANANEVVMVASLGKKSRNPIALIRREHKELIDKAAPKSSSKEKGCVGFLMNCLQRWGDWREEEGKPDRWVYLTLKAIHQELMGVFSIHTIRKSLSLMEDLKWLSVRKNNRNENWRNGQDKTHQYLLHVDRIEEALENRFSPSKAETLETSPFVNLETSGVKSEISGVKNEISGFTVETYIQIPKQIPSTDSYTLSEEREENEEIDFQEEINFVAGEAEDLWELPVNELEKASDILQEQKDSGEDQFSAPPASKCDELVYADAINIKPLKPLPKLKSDSEALLRSADRASGFHSQEERDGFYQALLKLGKSQGKKSPAAWASVIVRNVNAGEPCHYLNEYREGLLVGGCEQQEWEVAPGQPFEQFVSYLKTRNKKTGMTDEEAIAVAHRQLKNVNLARSLWESCKRFIVKCGDDWEKQKELGVGSAYLPPELLPEPEVTVEQVMGAMTSLQAGSVQLRGLAESAKLNCAADLEPAKELPNEPATAELEPVAAADDLEPVKELPSKSAIVETEPVAADAADLELAKELPSEPGSISAIALQEKLNSLAHTSPAHTSLARMMANKLGYRIEEGLVLPADEEIPSVEYLRSLLGNTESRPVTSEKIQRLIERNPQWGFYFDKFGELSDF